LRKTNKSTKTINFDNIVLKKLEDKAKRQGISVSTLTNFICKQVVLDDIEFYRELSKFHYLKFQEYQIMKEQCESKQETKD